MTQTPAAIGALSDGLGSRDDFADPLAFDAAEHASRAAAVAAQMSGGSQRESRRAPRLPAAALGPVLARFRRGTKIISQFIVYPFDFSVNGAGVLHAYPIDNGAVVDLEIRPADKPHFAIRGTVVRCVSTGLGVYAIGIQFEPGSRTPLAAKPEKVAKAAKPEKAADPEAAVQAGRIGRIAASETAAALASSESLSLINTLIEDVARLNERALLLKEQIERDLSC